MVALVQVVSVGLVVVGALTDRGLPWQHLLTEYLREHTWTRLAVLAMGVAVVVAVVGLWRLRWWGWALMVSLVGASLLLDLLAWWRLSADMTLVGYARLALDVVCAFYLNTTAVQDAFRGPSADGRPPSPADTLPVAGTRSAGRVDP